MMRDILHVGDVHAFRLSWMELHNAHAKCIAASGALRTLELRDSGKARAPLKSAEGSARLVETKGYSTTLAISTFRKVEAVQILRRGAADGVQMPESRMLERVFGEGGPGRLKARSTGVHLSKLGDGYDPRADSCVAAFARLW